MRACIICRAFVLAGLHTVRKDLKIHQTRDLETEYHVDSDPVIFVSDKYHRLLPVIPIQVVLEHSDRERMRDTRIISNDLLKPFTLKVRGSYVIGSSVHPIDTFGDMIDRYSIRPFDSGLDKQSSNI